MADAPPPRILVRAAERGPEEQSTHPWNAASEVHGWRLSRPAGLGRVAVNLFWLPPGRESFAYHRHFREEEWVYVLEGRGVALVDEVEHELGPGDFLGFPPGVAHLLRNTGDAPLRYLCGGEVVSDVEVADFPRLGRRAALVGSSATAFELTSQVPFAPGMATAPPKVTARVLVRAAERGEPTHFRHRENPEAEVFLTPLSRPAGLRRVAVLQARLPAGRDAFVYHRHQHDEEWMYVLAGHGVVEVDEVKHEVGPGDFLGFPAGGPAHNSRAAADSELVTVQGGDAWSRSTIEIVDFPRLGLRQTMVGTRSTMTFPLDAAREKQGGRR
jgi:quercetin 2,3-dioxygenase